MFGMGIGTACAVFAILSLRRCAHLANEALEHIRWVRRSLRK